jgi:hypothetical protein
MGRPLRDPRVASPAHGHQRLPHAPIRVAALLTVATVAASVAHPALATTIRVPQDQPTIAEGLAAASHGDTVRVAAGTYYESGLLMKPGVRLRSETGEPNCVTIDAEQLDTVIECFDVDGVARIEGFTLRNGLATAGNWPNGSAGGILCVDSSPTISKCVFENCNGRTAGGGVYSNGGSPWLVECTFLGNTARYGGGVAWHEGAPWVVSCAFHGNTAWYTSGGALVCSSTHEGAYISDCVFTHNAAALRGGAIGCSLCSATFVRCTLVANSAPTGAGASFWSAEGHLVELTLVDNEPSSGSGLSCVEGGTCYLRRSIIAFTQGGPAVECDPTSSAFLSCCDVYGNEGGDWVGPIADQAGLEGNICEDPLFCRDDNPEMPFSVHADSPCGAEHNPACGLIGAWPVACGQSSVATSTWTRIKGIFR